MKQITVQQVGKRTSEGSQQILQESPKGIPLSLALDKELMVPT